MNQAGNAQGGYGAPPQAMQAYPMGAYAQPMQPAPAFAVGGQYGHPGANAGYYNPHAMPPPQQLPYQHQHQHQQPQQQQQVCVGPDGVQYLASPPQGLQAGNNGHVPQLVSPPMGQPGRNQGLPSPAFSPGHRPTRDDLMRMMMDVPTKPFTRERVGGSGGGGGGPAAGYQRHPPTGGYADAADGGSDPFPPEEPDYDSAAVARGEGDILDDFARETQGGGGYAAAHQASYPNQSPPRQQQQRQPQQQQARPAQNGYYNSPGGDGSSSGSSIGNLLAQGYSYGVDNARRRRQPGNGGGDARRAGGPRLTSRQPRNGGGNASGAFERSQSAPRRIKKAGGKPLPNVWRPSGPASSRRRANERKALTPNPRHLKNAERMAAAQRGGANTDPRSKRRKSSLVGRLKGGFIQNQSFFVEGADNATRDSGGRSRLPRIASAAARTGEGAAGKDHLYASKRPRGMLGYKQYTLNDYKAKGLDQKVQLGGLGPSVPDDELAEKRERVRRAKDLAERIRTVHKRQIPAALSRSTFGGGGGGGGMSGSSFDTTSGGGGGGSSGGTSLLGGGNNNGGTVSKSQRAREYARSIAKPKRREPGASPQRLHLAQRHRRDVPVHTPIEAMELKHMIDLETVARIREEFSR